MRCYVVGGYKHRLGLADAFLIKENHIKTAGSIASVMQQARRIDANTILDIEVEDLKELQQALGPPGGYYPAGQFFNGDGA